MDKITFNFTKSEYLRICEEAMLNDFLKEIFEDKIKGLTIVEISQKRGASPEKVKRNVKILKNKILKVL